MRVLLFLVAGLAASSMALAAPQVTLGTLADGTPYRIDFPDQWNGALLVGLDYAARQGPAADALLARGYAMAGSTRGVTGWAIHKAAANAIETLDLFEAKYGKVTYPIELGNSQGGHTAAVSMQAYPQRWRGAVVQCGGLAGSVGQWQAKFDALFVARTLLAPASTVPVIGIPQDWKDSALPAWGALFDAAERSAQGRARIALAARIAQLPEWADPNKAVPAPGDLVARAAGLADSLVRHLLPQAMSSRAQIEQLSGGNITSNTGVDYATLLAEVDADGLIAALYRDAGISLADDLAVLAKAPRVAADPVALAYVASGVFDGNLQAPVITLSALGDAISPPASQQSYAAAVNTAGKGAMLRQVYTASAGHCNFTPSETVAAVGTLMERIVGARWPATGPEDMSRAAGATGLGPARFAGYVPPRFARPYGACELARALDAEKLVPVRVEGQAVPVCRN